MVLRTPGPEVRHHRRAAMKAPKLSPLPRPTMLHWNATWPFRCEPGKPIRDQRRGRFTWSQLRQAELSWLVRDCFITLEPRSWKILRIAPRDRGPSANEGITFRERDYGSGSAVSYVLRRRVHSLLTTTVCLVWLYIVLFRRNSAQASECVSMNDISPARRDHGVLL